MQNYIFVTVKNVIWGRDGLGMEISGHKDRNGNFSVNGFILAPASRSPLSKTSGRIVKVWGKSHYSASKIKH